MRPRYLVFITLLALCHQLLGAQALTDALPPGTAAASIPDDPSQEIVPLAQPEAVPPSGIPIQWDARRQTRVGDQHTTGWGRVCRCGRVASRQVCRCVARHGVKGPHMFQGACAAFTSTDMYSNQQAHMVHFLCRLSPRSPKPMKETRLVLSRAGATKLRLRLSPEIT